MSDPLNRNLDFARAPSGAFLELHLPAIDAGEIRGVPRRGRGNSEPVVPWGTIGPTLAEVVGARTRRNEKELIENARSLIKLRTVLRKWKAWADTQPHGTVSTEYAASSSRAIHRSYAGICSDLAAMKAARGDFRGAKRLLERAIDNANPRWGDQVQPDPVLMNGCRINYAGFLVRHGEPALAEVQLGLVDESLLLGDRNKSDFQRLSAIGFYVNRAAVKIARGLLHPVAVQGKSIHADGDLSRAEQLFEEYKRGGGRLTVGDVPLIAGIVGVEVALLEAWGRPDEVERFLKTERPWLKRLGNQLELREEWKKHPDRIALLFKRACALHSHRTGHAHELYESADKHLRNAFGQFYDKHPVVAAMKTRWAELLKREDRPDDSEVRKLRLEAAAVWEKFREGGGL